MSLSKKFAAEVIGTAVLVFVACGAAVVSGVDWVGTSLAFGFVIVAMAYSIGNVSGCHINPAVSFAMLVSKKMTGKEFGAYVCAQTIGGFIGAGLLGVCLRCDFTALGGNEIQQRLLDASGAVDGCAYTGAFIAEVVLTCVFVMAILGVTDSKFGDGKLAGLVIGLSLALVHLAGLGFTGTSVNPARSLAPAVLQAAAGNATSLSQIWIWILAPLVGGCLAAGIYGFLTSDK